MSHPTNPVEAIFSEAILPGDLERRAAFLAGACGDDVALRRQHFGAQRRLVRCG